MKLFLLDPDSASRRELAACLELIPGVESVAHGHQTREVAERLSYSERTVKNVLHDVVTKLNARSRSQAVAFAVGEGLI